MSIEVVPFEAGLGADIRGVDIREPLSSDDRDAIRAAWLDHLVLRFRDQPMTDAQHMAFTRQFGELEFNPAALIQKQYWVETQSDGRRREIPPEISVISNIIENGKAIGGLGDGEAFWHTDSSFVDVPPAASLLRSLEVPPPSAGGSTYFLNMYSAYETLPDDIKGRIAGLTAIHAATHSSGGKAHKGFRERDRRFKSAGRAPAVGPNASRDRAQGAVSRTADQCLCAGAFGRGQRGAARSSMGPHDAGQIHLAPGLAGRRSCMVGQSLCDAPP